MLAKLSLRQRIVIFSLVILVAGLGIFSWLSVQSVNDSNQRTLDQQLIIARLAASRLDETLHYILVLLQSTAYSSDINQSGEKFGSISDALSGSLNQSGVAVQNVLSVNKDGKVIFIEPPAPGLERLDLNHLLSVGKSLNENKTAISGLVSIPFIVKPVVLVSVPLPAQSSNNLSALVCAIDLDSSIRGPFSQALVIGKSGYTEIVDEKGMVIARTDPGLPLKSFEMSDHPGRFADLISQGKTTVGTCHRCHESGGNIISRNKDVLAFAPLSAASWGVAVRQPEEEALSPTWELEKKLIILGIILAVCTVLLVLVMMRGIIGPIRLLTSAARKIASGDLETAVPIQRSDEIGELSSAFQSMRQEINKSRKEMDSRYIAARDKGETRGGVLNSVIHTQEEERSRIARDLHDVSIQSLILVCRQLDGIRDNGNGLTPTSAEEIKSARSKVEGTITELRGIVKALRPPILDDLGLLASIRRSLMDFEERTGIKGHFILIGEDRRLPQEIELGIFRIANEAIWNIEHHSHATEATVTVTLAEEVKLEIQDNGVGFVVPSNLDDFSNRRKFGLLGMRERVELLGGRLEVNSAPGQGTRITVHVNPGNHPSSAGLGAKPETRGKA